MAATVAGANSDVWLFDIARGIRNRFTFDPAADLSPVWSPDGHTIVFYSARRGVGDLYRRQADGSKQEELLLSDSLQKTPRSFSQDGRHLAYTASGDPRTGQDVWIL